MRRYYAVEYTKPAVNKYFADSDRMPNLTPANMDCIVFSFSSIAAREHWLQFSALRPWWEAGYRAARERKSLSAGQIKSATFVA